MKEQFRKWALIGAFMAFGVMLMVSFFGIPSCAHGPFAGDRPAVDNSAPAAKAAATSTGGHIDNATGTATTVQKTLKKPTVTVDDVHTAATANDSTVVELVAAKTTNDQAIASISKSDSENQALQAQVKTLETTINTLKPKADSWDAYQASVADSWIYWRVGGKFKILLWVLGIGIVGIAILYWATDGASGVIMKALTVPIVWISEGFDWLVRTGAGCVGYIIGHITKAKAAVVTPAPTPAPLSATLGTITLDKTGS